MPTRCHLCYNTTFKDWIEFHDHYQEHHAGNLKDDKGTAEAIRAKAIATPKNASGRSKAKIVEDVEALHPWAFIVPVDTTLSDVYKKGLK